MQGTKDNSRLDNNKWLHTKGKGILTNDERNLSLKQQTKNGKELEKDPENLPASSSRGSPTQKAFNKKEKDKYEETNHMISSMTNISTTNKFNPFTSLGKNTGPEESDEVLKNNTNKDDDQDDSPRHT